MPGPSKHLERTRGRILTDAERVRVASQVQVVSGDECLEGKVRGRLVLALTDKRLLLVANTPWRGSAKLVLERPTGGLKISVMKRKLGGNLIHIEPSDERSQSSGQTSMIFEWVSGNKPREWASLRFRQ